MLGNSATAEGFTAQQSWSHGIYDGAWKQARLIAELDGGGHHAYGDRTTADSIKDLAHELSGNTVLREADENVLFLKALALLKELAP